MWDRLRYLKSMIEDGIPLVVAMNSQDTGADVALAAMSMWEIFRGSLSVMPGCADLVRRMGLLHDGGLSWICLELPADAVRLWTDAVPIVGAFPNLPQQNRQITGHSPTNARGRPPAALGFETPHCLVFNHVRCSM